MKLIDDWRNAYKKFSVQANGLSVAMIGAYVSLPEKMQDALPPKYVLLSAAAIAVLGTIGRMIKQEPKADEAPK